MWESLPAGASDKKNLDRRSVHIRVTIALFRARLPAGRTIASSLYGYSLVLDALSGPLWKAVLLNLAHPPSVLLLANSSDISIHRSL